MLYILQIRKEYLSADGYLQLIFSDKYNIIIIIKIKKLRRITYHNVILFIFMIMIRQKHQSLN